MPAHASLTWVTQNPQIVDQAATSFPGKSQRRGHTFAGRTGDGERRIAFATQAQRGHAGTVLDEQRRIHGAAHLGHVAHIARVNNAGVPIAVFVVLGQFNRVVDIATANEGQKGHHLFDVHKGMLGLGFTEQQFRLGIDGYTSCRGQLWLHPVRAAPW